MSAKDDKIDQFIAAMFSLTNWSFYFSEDYMASAFVMRVFLPSPTRSSKCVEDQLGSLNESYGSPDPYNLQYLLLQNLSALFS
jgi:hypothetical protein